MAISPKHALIVGASSGIGLAVAHQVAPLVTKLTLCSRSCPTDLVASIKAKNPDVEVVHESLDMSLLHEVRKFTIKHATTTFDWIVLTAGVLMFGDRSETVEGLDHAALASFMHIDPGFVRTNLLDNSAWYIRLPMKALSAVLADSPEHCGQIMVMALTADEFAGGWKLLDKRAKELPKTTFHTDELKDAVSLRSSSSMTGENAAALPLVGKKLMNRLGAMANEGAAAEVSAFARRQMEKMGWSAGKGLGKQEQGVVSHIKVKKRAELQGVGAEKVQAEEHKSQWWYGAYD
ncbi:hypothetical protein BBJ28_00023202, partial [Nothophytophthora sp. Chile5]